MATRERPGLSSAPTELIGPPAPPPAEPEPPPDRELWPWLLVLSVLVIAGLAALWYATRDSTGAAGPVTVQTTVAAQPATTEAAQPATTAATTTARTTAAPPRAVVVPDLVGQNGDEAVRTLEAQSLRPDVREVPSTEADGIVVSQHPAGGATVEARAGVLLNVAHHVEQPQPKPQPNGDENSQGDGHDQASALQTPVVATVPNVVGEDKDAAKADLAGAGFHVDKKNQDTSDPSQDGMVVDQSPPGGGSAPAASHVTIYVARYRD